MEIVATHLKAKALELLGDPEADLFGRSSFNRFYYSAYLDVRRELRILFPDAPTSHAVLPEYLTGEVSRALRRLRDQARRVDDHQLMQRCSTAIHAASGLSELLKGAYKTRAIADYEMEVLVDFSTGDGDFSLDDIKVSAAKSWPHRARAFVEAISGALKGAQG